MNRAHHIRLQALQLFMMGAFALIIAMLGYWYFLAPFVLSREDNPRLVEAEFRIQRGRIFDVQGILLADNKGEPYRIQRVYPLPSTAPMVGYYSLKHGSAGIEDSFDSYLRGDTANLITNFRRQVLHETTIGRDLKLTLNAIWQTKASELLGDNVGAILVLSPVDGSIQVMVSHPQYDPNQLDDIFNELVADEKAPLLNRVTQGQYQPGATLEPLIRAVAMTQGIGQAQTPISQLATQLTPADTQQIFELLGLTNSVALPINTEIAPVEPVQDVQLALAGQENLTVTPLQLGLAYGIFANAGKLPQPRIITTIQTGQNEWQVQPSSSQTNPVIPPQVALRILETLPQQQNIIEQETLTLSGPNDEKIAWYIGLTPVVRPQLVIIIVLENVSDSRLTTNLGHQITKIVFETR